MTDQNLEEKYPNPFPGPVPLSKKQAVFGRKVAIANLSSMILTERTVVLHGVSGAGKSSLLAGKGGIQDSFQKEEFSVLGPVQFREPPEVKGEKFYEKFLLDLLNKEEPQETRQQNRKFWGNLNLDLFLLANANRTKSKYQLLIIDQFEDFFAYHPNHIAAKKEFFISLGKCLAENPKLFLLLSMRDEYIGELDSYRKYIPRRLKAFFRLRLLNKRDAFESVNLTIKETGIRPNPRDAVKIINNISRFTVGNTDKNTNLEITPPIEPMLLQVVFNNLWSDIVKQKLQAPEKRCVSIPAKDLNLNDILTDFFDTLVKESCEKDPSQEYKLRALFQDGLVSYTGQRALVGYDKIKSTWGVSEELLKALVNKHLLRIHIRNKKSHYEISHDRLVGAIVEKNEKWLRKQPKWRRITRTWRKSEGGEDWLGPLQIIAGNRAKKYNSNSLTPYELTCLETQTIRRQKETYLILSVALFFALIFFLMTLQTKSLLSKQSQLRQATNFILKEQDELKNKNESLLDKQHDLESMNMQMISELDRIQSQIEISSEEVNVTKQKAEMLGYIPYKWIELNDQKAADHLVQSYENMKTRFINKGDRLQFHQDFFTSFNNVLSDFGSIGFSRDFNSPKNLTSPLAFFGGTTPLLAYTKVAKADGANRKEIIIYDFKNGQYTNTYQVEDKDKVQKLQFSPNGKFLAIKTNNKLTIKNVEPNEAVFTHKLQNTPGHARVALHFSQDSEVLAIGSERHLNLICEQGNTWNSCGGIQIPTEVQDQITAMFVSQPVKNKDNPESRIIVTGTKAGNVKLYNYIGGNGENSFSDIIKKGKIDFGYIGKSHDNFKEVIAVKYLNGPTHRLLVVHKNRKIELWDYNPDPAVDKTKKIQIKPDWGSMANLHCFELDSGNKIIDHAAIADNNLLYTSLDDRLFAWDLRTIAEQTAMTLQKSPNESSNGYDELYRVPLIKYPGGPVDLRSIALGDHYVFARGIEKIWLWERNNSSFKFISEDFPGEHTVPEEISSFKPVSIKYVESSRKTIFLAGTREGLLEWDTSGGDKQINILSEKMNGCESISKNVRAIAITAGDRKLVAAAMSDKTLMWMDLTGAQQAAQCNNTKHAGGVRALAFSPDDKWMVSGDWQSSSQATNRQEVKSKLLLWKVDSEKAHIEYNSEVQWNGSPVFSVAFGKENNIFAVGTKNGKVFLYNLNEQGDVSRGIELNFYQGQRIGAINSLSFSRDDKYLVAGGANGFIHAWQMDNQGQSATPLFHIKGHVGGVSSLEFNPAKDYIATGGKDGLVKVWNTNNWHQKQSDENLEIIPAILKSLNTDVLSITWNKEGSRLATGFASSNETNTRNDRNANLHGRILSWNWDLEDFYKRAKKTIWPDIEQ